MRYPEQSRWCQYYQRLSGSVCIRGRVNDASAIKRDLICKNHGWILLSRIIDLRLGMTILRYNCLTCGRRLPPKSRPCDYSRLVHDIIERAKAIQ